VFPNTWGAFLMLEENNLEQILVFRASHACRVSAASLAFNKSLFKGLDRNKAFVKTKHCSCQEVLKYKRLESKKLSGFKYKPR